MKHVKMKLLTEILEEKCPGAWAGGTLKSPLGVDVDDFGFVTIPPSASIGNAREVSLRKIIDGYNYRDFPVISALHDGGMRGLMNLASEYGFTPKKAYLSGCNFCYETRKFIRRLFPEAFAFVR